MENYSTLAGEGTVEVVMKKSRFIGLASPISSPEAAEERLAQVRVAEPEASHHVFAYALAMLPSRSEWVLSRMSDDGEPSGTAGRPVMGVLERSGLEDVLLVVTRYFGGTLLGASGLVRAYTKAAAEALAVAPKAMNVLSRRYRWTVPYTLYGSAMNSLSKTEELHVEDSDFTTAVDITFTAPAALHQRMYRQLRELVQGEPEWETLETLYLQYPWGGE